MSEDLRSSRSVSPDEAFPHWAAPIAACVRNFKGGTLIVNSAPFRDALVEAERIVSTTIGIQFNIPCCFHTATFENLNAYWYNFDKQIIKLLIYFRNIYFQFIYFLL